jgi:epoxyqueuosine reductase
MFEELRSEAARQGLKLGAISVERLADVKRGFDVLGMDISPYFNFGPRDDLGFEARSVLAVAAPCPIQSVRFAPGGEARDVIIPPTYTDADDRQGAIEALLRGALDARGYQLARANALPCKPIAVHAGIAEYGRNDIAYAEGMGSFFDIALFFSDMAIGFGVFSPLKRMDSCEGCTLCVENCPTGALSVNKEFINGDICLTNINERDDDFPDWIKPEWHHALAGCIKCQDVCPQNAPYINNVKEIASYSEEETRAIMRGDMPEELLAPMKLGWLSKIAPRNLKALFGDVDI